MKRICHSEPVFVGHIDIDEGNIRTQDRCLFKGGFTIRSFTNDQKIRFNCEPHLQSFTYGELIFNDE